MLHIFPTTSYFAHSTTKTPDNITDGGRETRSSPFFLHLIWTVMHRTVQNKTRYALVYKALI